MRRTRYPIAALLLIAAGLTLRRVPLGLPIGVVKYGGSILWAMMLYALLATLRPTAAPHQLGLGTLALATSVECFKLVHTPALDIFRRTLSGTLLLGRFFSFQDLAAYSLAITLAATLDHRTRRVD
jgi:hypothetical protein